MRLTHWIIMMVLMGMMSSLSVHATSSQPPEMLIRFDHLPRGKIGALQITGTDIERVRAAFLDHQYLFVPSGNDAYAGFITAPIDVESGVYRLSVLITHKNGEQEYVAQDIRVTSGVFDQFEITLPETLRPLLDPELLLDEFAVLKSALNSLTLGGAWLNSGLNPPVESGIGAQFGTYRLYNGQVWQRHTGIDYPAPVGTPVKASASGRVVLSKSLPIRGNYILIDHGSGLMTGYAHLNETYFVVGDAVAQSEVIGTVGNTGRSTGGHLHWEVALGGAWVDPIELVNLIDRAS